MRSLLSDFIFTEQGNIMNSSVCITFRYKNKFFFSEMVDIMQLLHFVLYAIFMKF